MRSGAIHLGAGLGCALLFAALFPMAAATHEVMHMATFGALGYRSVLVTTPWRLHFADVRIVGLHAAPLARPPAAVQLIVNLAGPLLAAVPVAAVAAVSRSRLLTAAALGNVIALVYFAVIEAAYQAGERFAGLDLDFLLWPETNYGPVVLVMLTASVVVAVRR